MLKIIGAIIILLSSCGLGFIYAMQFSFRVRELKLLKISLQMLETEIVYSNTPLPIAFSNVSKRSNSPIKDLFECTSMNLNKKSYSTVGEAFENSLNTLERRLSFSKEDLELIKSFGYSLGNSDVEGQTKNFRLILKSLDAQEFKAEELKTKNEKLYKNLGFLSGLAVVILLM